MEIIIIIIIIIKQEIKIRFLGVILSVEVEKRGTRKSWRKDDTGELRRGQVEKVERRFERPSI